MSDVESTIKGVFGVILVAIGFVLLLYPILLILTGDTGLFLGIIYLLLFTLPAGIIMFVGARLLHKSANVNVVQTVGGESRLTCPNCGVRNASGAKFCSECGAKLVK